MIQKFVLHFMALNNMTPDLFLILMIIVNKINKMIKDNILFHIFSFIKIICHMKTNYPLFEQFILKNASVIQKYAHQGVSADTTSLGPVWSADSI